MTEQLCWEAYRARYTVGSVEPTERHLFVVTLLDGKCVEIRPEHEYKTALFAANALLKQHDVAIKVLPVTFKELVQLHGFDYAAFMDSMSKCPVDPAFKKACVDRMMQIVSNERADPRVRTEAFNLLKTLGAVHA